MMPMTITAASTSAFTTSSIEPRMNTASSLVMRISVPSGNCVCSRSTMALTPFEMLSVFDCAWRMMPMPMPALPLERSAVDDRSGPKVTVATSPRRTLSPMISRAKSSGVLRSAVARTTMSCVVEVIEPAGTSKAILESAEVSEATVSPRLASAAWSTSMRKILSWSP